ncbi:hypothetical protein OAN61_00590 [bacterium]|nr:hypothetical protein [bacterium]
MHAALLASYLDAIWLRAAAPGPRGRKESRYVTLFSFTSSHIRARATLPVPLAVAPWEAAPFSA